MQDEPNQPVVEEEVIADEPQLAQPTAMPEEPVEEASENEEEPIVEEETPEETPPSNRLLTRAQKLLEKYGPPQQRPSTLPPQRSDALDYGQALDADPEVIKQLEADRQRTQQSYYNEGLRRAEAIEFKTNIRLDLPLVEERMKQLDPRDAEALDKEYLYAVGFDPQTGYVQNSNIGYAEFIEAKIEMAHRLATSMSAETTKNVARQAATTGLRPDGSSAKRLNLNKAPEDMSVEELYAKLGQKPPK